MVNWQKVSEIGSNFCHFFFHPICLRENACFWVFHPHFSAVVAQKSRRNFTLPKNGGLGRNIANARRDFRGQGWQKFVKNERNFNVILPFQLAPKSPVDAKNPSPSNFMQRQNMSIKYIRRRREKSTAILVAIVVIFLICHTYKLVPKPRALFVFADSRESPSKSVQDSIVWILTNAFNENSQTNPRPWPALFAVLVDRTWVLFVFPKEPLLMLIRGLLLCLIITQLFT